MKKRILACLVFVIMMLNLTGCAKLVSTAYENVEVDIVDEHYEASYITLEYNIPFEMFMPETVPAVYKIIVEYNGIQYVFNDSDTYNKYKDKVGETTIGTLEIRTYDDGTIKSNITELE